MKCLKFLKFWQKRDCRDCGEERRGKFCFLTYLKEFLLSLEEIIFRTIRVKPHERIYRDILDYYYLTLFVCGYLYQLVILYIFFFFSNVWAPWFEFVPCVAWLKGNWHWMKILMPFLAGSYAAEIYWLIITIYSGANLIRKHLENGNGNGNGDKENYFVKNGGNGDSVKKKRGGQFIFFSWIVVLIVMIVASALWGYEIHGHDGPFGATLGLVGLQTIIFIATRFEFLVRIFLKVPPSQNGPRNGNSQNNNDKSNKKSENQNPPKI